MGETTPRAGHTAVPSEGSKSLTPTMRKHGIVTVAPPPLEPLRILPKESGPPSLSHTSNASTEMYTPMSQAPSDVQPETTLNRMLWNYRPATSSKTASGSGFFGTNAAAATRISKRLSDVRAYPLASCSERGTDVDLLDWLYADGVSRLTGQDYSPAARQCGCRTGRRRYDCIAAD